MNERPEVSKAECICENADQCRACQQEAADHFDAQHDQQAERDREWLTLTKGIVWAKPNAVRVDCQHCGATIDAEDDGPGSLEDLPCPRCERLTSV